MQLMGNEIGTNEPSAVIEAFTDEKKSEDYKKFDEKLELRKFNSEEIVRIANERKAVAADYVRSFFFKNADRKVKDYMNGLNFYQDKNSRTNLTSEMLKTQAENSAEVAKSLEELSLDKMFKKFAKDMAGSKENRKFGASYLYNELERQRMKIRSKMEKSDFRRLSESEQKALREKENLLYDIMDSLNTFSGHVFNLEKSSARNMLVNYSKSSKPNIVKTLVRNLSFMRKH